MVLAARTDAKVVAPAAALCKHASETRILRPRMDEQRKKQLSDFVTYAKSLDGEPRLPPWSAARRPSLAAASGLRQDHTSSCS